MRIAWLVVYAYPRTMLPVGEQDSMLYHSALIQERHPCVPRRMVCPRFTGH